MFGRMVFGFGVDEQTGNGHGCVGSRVFRWDEQTVCPQWRVNGLRRSGGRDVLAFSTAQRGQERSGRRRLSGMDDGCRERNAS